MSDAHVLASSNVSQAYVNPLAGSYSMTASVYVRSAEKLRGPADGIPELTLLLFALEVALKAFLLDNGTPDTTLKQPKARHDLKELHDLAVTAGFASNPELTQVIDDYRTDHKGHAFRYGERDYVDMKNPDRALRAISAAVGAIGKSIKMQI